MDLAPTLDLRNRLTRLQNFLTDEIWETRLDSLPRWQALRYRALRMIYCAAHGMFVSDALSVRAAALTYFTVLSLVPLLAFVFAMLKGFGAYDALVENSLRPYLLDTFAGNAPLQRAVEQILVFVRDTDVTRLGFIGLLALLYAAISLLRNIEAAFNETWGVREGRSLLRQVTDYAAIIMVTPLCLLLAAGLGTLTQVMGTLRSLQERLGLGGFIDWSIGIVGPFVVITLGLVFLYMVMPNTSVRVRSALSGGLVGGVLWYALLILHVNFQLGVARFNALYSGFGILPIFLVWVYVSWLAVMVGGQAAAMHQQDRTLTRRVRTAVQNQRYTEAVGLSAVLRIARAFVASEPRPSLQQLSEELEAPEMLIEDLLDRVQCAGLVVKTGDGGQARFVLGRMPDQVLVKQVLDALKRAPLGEDEAAPLQRMSAGDPATTELLAALDHDLEQSPHNLSLKELLAEQLHRSAGATNESEAAAGGYHGSAAHR